MSDIWRFVYMMSTILGDYDEHGRGETYWFCPFCHHHKKKLAINVYKKKWQCWKCGARGGSLKSLIFKLDVPKDMQRQMFDFLNEDLTQPEIEQVETKLRLPEEYRPLWIPNGTGAYQDAVRYLRLRDITAGDIMRYRMGYCEAGRYRNRIIFPSYDEYNQLNYFVARDFYDVSNYKYMNPPVSKNIVSFANHLNWNEPVVLCEGYFDALKIKWNAIPLLGTYMQENVRIKLLYRKVKNVYVCFDNDDSKAQNKALRICKDLMDEGINVHNVILEKSKDPADYGFTDLITTIRNAPKLNLERFLLMRLT